MARVDARTTIRAATAEEAVDLGVPTLMRYFAGGAYPEIVVMAFAASLIAICRITLIRASVLAGQIANETKRFTFGGQVKAEQFNWAGLGATDDGAAGLSFAGPEEAVGAVSAHHGGYLFGDKWQWPIAWMPIQHLAVRLPFVMKAGYGGTVTVLGDYGGGPWASDPDYAEKVAIHANALLALEASMATPKEVTDRIIAALRERGCTVYDMRGQLPTNKRYPYGQVRGGLGRIRNVIQHWTGDAFGAATIKQITGTDYGLNTISPKMTVEDEIDMLRWYANFHMSKDGGTWGGIAYGMLVFPSGRIYVAWDLGTLTYHAFSVNGYSYALCCPNSNGQAPTDAQILALNHLWDLLFEHTPEIPAGWGDLLGHTEAKALDAQNQTSCPGPALLAHVQRARKAGGPSVALGTPPTPVDPATPPANPSAARVIVEGTGEEFWIIEPILGYYRANGGFGRFGWPETGMYTETVGEAKGLPVQYFERARLEIQPNGTVTEGRLGSELLALRESAA